MGSISIGSALFGKTQQAVLGLLFGQPGRSFYLRELVGAIGAGASQVQSELARLVSAGLVTREPRGNQVWFQANPVSPVFQELKALVAKTSGVADIVREALAPFARQIDAAFIYGSVARNEHDALSDVDLMVVGSVTPSRSGRSAAGDRAAYRSPRECRRVQLGGIAPASARQGTFRVLRAEAAEDLAVRLGGGIGAR